MVSGQRRAGEVVKAPGAGLAPIALPMRLGVVAPIADHRTAAAAGAAHALRPAMLAHQREALGVIQQPREVDQFRCRHDRPGPLRAAADQRPPSLITAEAPCNGHPLLCPATPRNPSRAAFISLTFFFMLSLYLRPLPHIEFLCDLDYSQTIWPARESGMWSKRNQERHLWALLSQIDCAPEPTKDLVADVLYDACPRLQ